MTAAKENFPQIAAAAELAGREAGSACTDDVSHETFERGDVANGGP